MIICRVLKHFLFAACVLSFGQWLEGSPKEAWDANKLAKGWARMDATGSMVFYDDKTHSINNWAHGTGLLSRLYLNRADRVPQRWVMDDDKTWITEGGNLKLLDKNGKEMKKVQLPGEVGDIDILPDGLIISYRTLKPYVEKRDIRNGGVVWSYGAKPGKADYCWGILHRVVRNEDKHIFLMSGDSLIFTLLDSKKGKDLGQILFTYKGKLPPEVKLGKMGRGPVVWGWGSNAAYTTLGGSQVPSIGNAGLLLIKLDISASEVEFFAVDLAEGHHLVGIIEKQAVFTAPQGGLVYVPLKPSENKSTG